MSEANATAQASTDAVGVTQNDGAAAEAAAKAAAPEAKAAPAADAPAEQKAPEAKAEVDYKFELPEGIDIDEPAANNFKALAKELQLSQDAAQKVVAFAAQRELQRAEAHRATVKGWADTVTADKELGKAENQAIARKAVETFGSPELKTLLERSGLGNHPELVRAFFNAGKAISEGKFIAGRTGPAPTTDLASLLYPNQA